MAASWLSRQTGMGLPETAAWLIGQGVFGDGPTAPSLERLPPDSPLNQRLLRWINSPLFNLDQELATLEQAVPGLGGRASPRPVRA